MSVGAEGSTPKSFCSVMDSPLISIDAFCQPTRSKHINLRTRIKRFMRRTLCFSKTERMHDLVIGLFINRYEFGRSL